MEDIADILIVDDTAANLQVLGLMLRQNKYKVRPVPSGKLALQAVAACPPDLILLDITMPEMNGYEVASKLKENPATAEIPIIFISALTEVDDKVKAFKSGGVDYITKPFQIEEVLSRVSVHLVIQRQRRELRRNYERIKELEGVREKLTRLIVHDMRSPLGAIRMHYEILGEKNPAMDEESKKSLQRGISAADTLIDMTNSLLDIARLREGRMPLKIESAELGEIERETVANAAVQIGSSGRVVKVEPSDAGPVVAGVDRSLIRRVVQNILGNAIKFTDAKSGVITLGARLAPDGHRIITIADNGPGIPPEFRSKIFEEFWQIEGTQVQGVHSSGLGLNFCKLAVEAHGGSVVVRDAPGGHGSLFEITLPETPSARAA